MSRMSRIVKALSLGRGRDIEFENYYGSLIATRRDGVPSATEARRDYEVVRRNLDRAILF